MTKNKFLQSFLLLSLLIILAPSAYAVSEVSGTLSSPTYFPARLAYAQDSIQEPSVDGEATAIIEEVVELEDSSNQIARAFVPAPQAGISIGSWLLILLLVLALITVISYLYNRTLRV